MKKMTSWPIETLVAKFLFYYRLMPHASTGQTPAELCLGHHPQSLLDNIKPDVSTLVRRRHENQKLCLDAHTSARKFNVNDAVFICKFSQWHYSLSWVPGTIEAVRGPFLFPVHLSDNRHVCCHIDHILRQFIDLLMMTDSNVDDFLDFPIPTTKPWGSSKSHPSLPVFAPRHTGRIRQPPDHWCPSQEGKTCSNLT